MRQFPYFCVSSILKELILNRFKQLGKDSIIYGLGGILAKSVSFFMLPIYTRIFSPSDYGTIEMLTVIKQFCRGNPCHGNGLSPVNVLF